VPPLFRQSDVQNPHFRLPFQFGGLNGGAFMNEQDTGDDVLDCIRAIIAFPIGSRHDNPAFGVPDLLFKKQGRGIIQQLRQNISEWEDRADIDTEGYPNVSDASIWQILVKAGLVNDA
jgi:phage baseplate assembly protein W